MILFTTLLLLNSLYIYGVYNAAKFQWVTDDDHSQGVIESSKNILWKLNYYTQKWFGPYWSKPFFKCPVCMSSIHSSYIYWVAVYLYGYEPKFILMYVFYVGCLGGVNWIVSEVMDLIESISGYFYNH